MMNRIIGQEGSYQAESKTETNKGKEPVIPVVEENIHIDKRIMDADKVRISKKVNTEDVTVNVPTTHEEVTVKHIAVNQYVDSPPSVKQEGDVTIIPIVKEVLVVEKRLMLVEEVHVTKRRVETSVAQNETLRKEEVIIDRDQDHSGSTLK
jgi:uncharacterized protein (TIGR02271 family)